MLNVFSSSTLRVIICCMKLKRYGDFTPVTPAGKILCSLYLFVATALFGAIVGTIAQIPLDRRQERQDVRHHPTSVWFWLNREDLIGVQWTPRNGVRSTLVIHVSSQACGWQATAFMLTTVRKSEYDVKGGSPFALWKRPLGKRVRGPLPRRGKQGRVHPRRVHLANVGVVGQGRPRRHFEVWRTV